MRLTMPASAFGGMASRVLKFRGRGSDVHAAYSLALVEVTAKGRARLSAGNPSGGARVAEKTTSGEPGSTCMLLDHLDKAASILPASGELSLWLDGPRVRARAGSVTLEFPAMPADNFMRLPQPPRDDWFQVPAESVLGVAKHVRWAMSEDEFQPRLAGVHLTAEFSEATDTRKLAQLRPGIVPEGTDVVVPSDIWQNISAFVDKKPVKMNIDGTRVWMRGDGWAVCNITLADRFINTDGLVFKPDDDNIHTARQFKWRVHWILINREEVLNAVRRIQSASTRPEEKKFGAGVRFEVVDGSLHLISHYPIEDMSNSVQVDEIVDWGQGSVMEGDSSSFEFLRNLSLYSLYMNKALSSLNSDVVKMMWADPGDQKMTPPPIQFHDDDIRAAALVSPRRISSVQEAE